jgi:hypothetical protein
VAPGQTEKHLMPPTKSERVPVDCGCETIVFRQRHGCVVEIDYCPLHEAAPELVEALKRLTVLILPYVPVGTATWHALMEAKILIGKAAGVRAGRRGRPGG